MVGTTQDVTERKRLEEDLLQARKMESVGRLAGGVAHDFNNLLTVILGHAELTTLRLPPDDPAQAGLRSIRAAADQGAQLVQQLLAFARRQMVQPRDVDLAALLRGMETLLRRVIGENIELTIACAVDTCMVLVDRTQMEQVLLNLSLNARDAMPEGGRLTLELRRVGPHAVVRVSDSGAGMTPDVQANIFEPFFTTKEPGRGFGLGLASVYGMVKQNHGDITVESAPGRGTCFSVRLPALETAPVLTPEPAMLTAPPRGKETVLLVEDEAQVRRMIGEVLEGAGYQVLAAANGPEALAIFEQQGAQIDLLLTDVVMPRMSGRELARQVRERRPALPVLFMTGYDPQTESDEALLLKPLSPTRLAARIRDVLDRGRVDT